MMRLALVVFILAVIIGYNMYDNFDPGIVRGKRVLVTGASSGIGEQLAYHYARLGAKLVITARSGEKLQQVIARCREIGGEGGQYHYITADMEDYYSTHKVIQGADEFLGGLDYLVLNHIMISPLGEWRGSADNFTLLDTTLAINFKAYVHLASHAMPLLERSRGNIVVVTSIAGRFGQPYIAAYSASKFALDGFFNGLLQELAMQKIDVSITQCVIGLIGTENSLKALTNFGANFLLKNIPVAEPADAAWAILKGGALRSRTIYYPYIQARLPVLFRDIMPNTVDSIVRFTMQRN